MSRRRYKLLNVGLDELLRLLVVDHRFVVVEGLPAGAKIVKVGYAPGDRFGIVLEHPDWPPVDCLDLNALPTVGSKIAEVIPGPTIKVTNQKTGASRQVQAYLQKSDLEGDAAAPPPAQAPSKIVLAGASELGAAIKGARPCAACGGTGKGN